MHGLFRVSVAGDVLSVAPLDYGWFTRAIEQKLAGRLLATLDDRRNVVVSSSTADLRRWLTSAPAEAVTTATTYRRAGGAGGAGRASAKIESRAGRFSESYESVRDARIPQLLVGRGVSHARTWAPTKIYAVRFATIAGFPVSSLVAGADRGRRIDIAMMVWVLKGANGRIAIVDSGFHRERYFQQFAVRDYIKPSEAIAPLGIKPEEVTDLLVTHMHWDHAGGIGLFPNARVWIQKDEYDYYTGAAWQSANTHGGIDAEDVVEIVRRNTQGKVSFVRGDDETSLPGIGFGVGGKHTWASQFVSVQTAARWR